MSIEHEPKLLVGATLEEVRLRGKVDYKGDRWELRDTLEYEDMLHIEDCDWVGFEVNEEQTLSLNMFTFNKVSDKARQFEKITGVPAKVKACVNTY